MGAGNAGADILRLGDGEHRAVAAGMPSRSSSENRSSGVRSMAGLISAAAGSDKRWPCGPAIPNRSPSGTPIRLAGRRAKPTRAKGGRPAASGGPDQESSGSDN
ncbi:hypothetical protein BLTE_24700 [Blastochloris tepida]|uniref:Uncharacterized protein n=1 Tax=Blastochloris tepida TaxID=2233851 RepID=A0A348G2K2_9HYPH|nr:hypothetical protein BLTE_24700 [Blastochloris tepida]